ncbi:hypothetical protein D1AOALGA4SA_3636 [Olavius algarvensis Delta 1 endosymbiont]|nr:hypothetical protein D1AOALGA4SA_3636 [Olavius algarvensis Delta 1 endosymbiont]
MHYAARYFCKTIKLTDKMPKIAKCLKCLKLRNSIDFRKKSKVCIYIHWLIYYFAC